MTTIEPGTPVRVVIEGVLDLTNGSGWTLIRHEDETLSQLSPAVTVTPLDPERPTLDRETLALAVRNADHAWTKGSGLKTHETWTGHLTDAILALIHAAHPEWTP